MAGARESVTTAVMLPLVDVWGLGGVMTAIQWSKV